MPRVTIKNDAKIRNIKIRFRSRTSTPYQQCFQIWYHLLGQQQLMKCKWRFVESKTFERFLKNVKKGCDFSYSSWISVVHYFQRLNAWSLLTFLWESFFFFFLSNTISVFFFMLVIFRQVKIHQKSQKWYPKFPWTVHPAFLNDNILQKHITMSKPGN